MTLLGALAAAGGIRYSANIEEVEIVRQVNADKVHLVVNLESISQGTDNDVRLKHGDLVRVPSDPGRRLSEDTFESIARLVGVGVSVQVGVGSLGARSHQNSTRALPERS